MTAQNKISPQTYLLAKLLKDIRSGKDKADNLTRETGISGSVKQRFRMIVSRLAAAENEILGPLNPASRQVMETQLLNMDSTAQIEGIVDMLLALPQHSRDTIEQYVCNVHKLNQIQNG